MELKIFRYILSIAEEGSISRASQKLFVSQSSLSQLLKNLEHSLSTNLFVRSSEGVVPTTVGIRFIEMATQIVEKYDYFKNEVHTGLRTYGQRLSLGMPTFRSLFMTPHIMNAFMKNHPDIRIEIVEGTSDVFVNLLSQHTIDLAFTALPPDKSPVRFYKIRDEEIYFFASENHQVLQKPIVHRRKDGGLWIDPSDLCHVDFIVLREGTSMRNFTDRIFSYYNIKAPNLHITESIETAISIAQLGKAFTFAPKAYCDQYSLSYTHNYSIGEKGWLRPMGIAYPRDIELSVAMLDLIDIISRMFL